MAALDTQRATLLGLLSADEYAHTNKYICFFICLFVCLCIQRMMMMVFPPVTIECLNLQESE